MRFLVALVLAFYSFSAFASSCLSSFVGDELPRVVHARDLGDRVRTNSSFTLSDGAEVLMGPYGYFSVMKNGKKVFNSEPRLYKLIKSTTKVNDPGIPHGLVPAYDGYFLNFQEPMRVDIWKYPIVKRPKQIYVSPVLGYHTDPYRAPKRILGVLPLEGPDALNHPVGFTRHLRDSGHYPWNVPSESRHINVGHVAFVASKNGSVYAIYEILRNFSGRTTGESVYDPSGMSRGMYARQHVHLVRFDLRNGTATNLSTWDGPSVGWGIENFNDEPGAFRRPTNFRIQLSDDEKSVQVFGDTLATPLISLEVQ